MNIFNCEHVDKKYNLIDAITLVVYGILSFIAGGLIGAFVLFMVNLRNRSVESSMIQQYSAVVSSFGFLGLMVYVGAYVYMYRKCTGKNPGQKK